MNVRRMYGTSIRFWKKLWPRVNVKTHKMWIMGVGLHSAACYLPSENMTIASRDQMVPTINIPRDTGDGVTLEFKDLLPRDIVWAFLRGWAQDVTVETTETPFRVSVEGVGHVQFDGSHADKEDAHIDLFYHSLEKWVVLVID